MSFAELAGEVNRLPEYEARRLLTELLDKIDPSAQCICEDGSQVFAAEEVKVCAYHSGLTWAIVLSARRLIPRLAMKAGANAVDN